MRNQQPTAFRTAFERLPVSVLSTPLGKRVFKSLESAAKPISRPIRREKRA